MTRNAVVLDLDGVILQSNAVTRRAMLRLFARHPQQAGAIAAYVAANPGVRRDDKIRYILGCIVGVDPHERRVVDYLMQYEQELGDALSAAPLVPGADALLADNAHTFYVSSSAPESEVRDQLARRALDHRFAAIFGATTPKAHALRHVAERHTNHAIVFFGDSVGDWGAARDAGVAFVGVICEGDTFGDAAITKLVDFSSPAAVRASMRSALSALEHRRSCTSPFNTPP
jgi:phosphoglycolate phosphatase-like HAD superfamily hydrolase